VTGDTLTRISPLLDASFRPASVARAEFEAAVEASGRAVRVTLALVQPSGAVGVARTWLSPPGDPAWPTSRRMVERLAKRLIWTHGGSRLLVSGPSEVHESLARHYARSTIGRFDARMMADIYGCPFEVSPSPDTDIPAARGTTGALGGHLDGCRVGFDLGASDRKSAAVIDGEVVFSEEIAWDPLSHADPAWHAAQILESIRRAAAHLPRVDAIGGSAAGVYVDGEVRVASLFRAVPRDAFVSQVRPLFCRLRERCAGVPFVVVNDGEVTALAGSMSIGSGALLGIALGSSEAAGYVTAEGRLTSSLDELAFVPIDFAPRAPIDEWSGDRGCGVQYLSQQAVGRLLPAAGLEFDAAASRPERLVLVQDLMAAGDRRAAHVYATIGTYLGYALIEYRESYAAEHVLLLGRVMSGTGGDLIVEAAQAVLRAEAPDWGVRIHTASERDKRHGQAVAAASLAPSEPGLSWRPGDGA
jgi:predicted NBD/HSP70 family sugar kinase